MGADHGKCGLSHRRDRLGCLSRRDRALGSRVTLDFGARLDRVATEADARKANLALYTAYHGTTETSHTDVLPSGRAKVSIQLLENVDAAIAVGHTARVAQATERFMGLRRKGADWVGNPALEPKLTSAASGRRLNSIVRSQERPCR